MLRVDVNDYSMTVATELSSEEAKKLAEELSALSRRQSEALQIAAYMKMSKEEAEHYDERARRIGQICGQLRKFRPQS
jgi:hypothetical protein